MSRLPRIIVPGIPHHVAQRGNRRQRVFMEDDDYALQRLASPCVSLKRRGCLILLPDTEPGSRDSRTLRRERAIVRRR